MQNLAIFHESNKDAAYYRQQVSERGILEKIDALNEGFLKIEGVTVKNLPLVYEVLNLVYEELNEVEISLNKNANDPRTRMALQNFTIVDEKVEEKATAIDLDDTDNTMAESDLIGEPDSTENADTQEPTGESGSIEKIDTQEPTGEPDPAEKVDTAEPTSEPATEQQEPTGEPDPAEKVDTEEHATEQQEPAAEPTAETPEPKNEPKSEPKKGGRKKKDAE